MVLSPTNFAVPNSTTLKILFNINLSKEIGVENIEVIALEGGLDNLKVKEVSVSGRLLVITTNPQSSGGFYKIFLKDSDVKFQSESMALLSETKKALYFVGFKKFNPIRDRIVNKVTKAYSKNNSNISRIIDVHADELYEAQRSIGQTLNDNYIRVSVKDEIRKRSSSAKDQLSHENCFKIKRVSLSPQGVNFGSKKITLSELDYRNIDDNEVISLQEVYSKKIVSSENFKKFGRGFIITLGEERVIKVLSIKFTKQNDVEDCEGNIGTEYPLKTIKYGIQDNFYDKSYSYSRADIESNQIFINDFGFDHSDEDEISIEYLHKDLSIMPDLETLSIYYVDQKNFEPVPLNSNSFELENKNICLEDGSTPIRSGISFYKDFSNKDDKYFTKELGSAEKTGDYYIDYEKGSIGVFGDNGSGIEEDVVLASYKYKKDLSLDYDFYVDDEFNLFVNYYSIYLGNKINIEYEYSNIFAEGIHYKNSTNLESIKENVGSSFSDFFTIETKNSPVTEVFRIFNKTTGEVYQPVSIFQNKVRFSASKSPQFLTIEKEVVKFLKKNNENLVVSNKIPETIGSSRVSSSNDNVIYFEPIGYTLGSGIDFFIKSLDRDYELKISSFVYQNGRIIGCRFSSNSSFIIQERISIFYNVSQIKLSQSSIMGLENFIGNHINTSLSLDSDIFKKEISLESEEKYGNFGDYKVDYEGGFIYAAINDSKPGSCSYRYGSFNSVNPRIMSIDEIGYSDYEVSYNIDGQNISVLNMPGSIESEVDNSTYDFRDNSFKRSLTVNEDKTILTSKEYFSIRHMDLWDNIYDNSQNKFDEKKHSYEKNIIDLKIKEKSKFSISNEGAEIKTKLNSDKIFKIVNSSDSSILYFNGNLTKISFVAKKSTYESGLAKIYLSADEISEIDIDDQVYAEGAYHNIISINHISNYIEVSSNKEVFEGDIVRVLGQLDENGKKKISIPFDMISFVNLNDYYEIQYFESDGISVGSRVFVDYNLGPLFVGYTYVKDEVEISYQHGDNSLDWSSSGALVEGQEYYVDYEFGALRTELKKNFGVLTEIPFFNNFELNVDREFYRDALEGTLQSFSNGPIITSYENLIESITDTSPNIEESFYRGWILDSDYLSSNRIEYSDGLTFETCKYKEGLFFGDKSFVSISSDNKMPISEGTISAWTQNGWSGISNDADISFDIYNCGNEKYLYNKDLVLRVESGSRVLSEESGFYLQNYFDKNKNFVMASKKILALNPGCNIDLDFDFKINDAGEYAYNLGEFFSFSINDSNRIIDFEVIPKYIGSSSPIEFVIQDIDYADAPNISPRVPTISCKCVYPDANEIFGFLSQRVEIFFDTNIVLSEEFLGNFEIEQRPFYLQDDANGIYRVINFIDEFGNSSNTKFSGEIKGVIVERNPVFSEKSITKKFVSKDFLVPNSSFKIFCGAIIPKTKTSSFEIKENYKNGILFDIAATNKIKLFLDPIKNIVRISKGLSKNKAEFFYSDFYKKDSVSSYRQIGSKFSKYISDYSGINFSVLNEKNNSNVFVSKIKYDLNHYINPEDIYIGKDSISPKLSNFAISGDDESAFGLPSKYSENKGVFIFKDESRKDDFFNPAKSNWSVRIKEISTILIPESVNSDGSFEYSEFSIDEPISGKVVSENNFYRATFSKDLDQFLSNEIDISMRYSKGSLINDGWGNLDKSFPEATNIFLDGVETFSYSWFSNIDSNEAVLDDHSVFITNNVTENISTKVASLTGLTSFEINSKISINKNNLLVPISSKDNSFYTGIRPIEISSDSIHISSEYIILNGKEGLLISDEKTGSTIGISYFKWNNKEVSIKLELDKKNGLIFLYIDDSLNMSKSLSLGKSAESAVLSFVTRTKGFYSGDYNFEVLYMKYSSEDPKFYEDADDRLEIGEDYIEFSFKNHKRLVDLDYSYDYEEDYNELLFVSDKDKVMVESSSDESSLRIFKDGWGYLNFEINSMDRSYSISHDIKNLEERSLSHIASSWSINETDNRMSLYFNGKEVPNVYTLGSQIDSFADEKFGDISKEKIQDSFFSLVSFYEEGTMNTTADSNYATSDYFSESDIGKFVEVTDSDLYPDLVGALIYVHEINNGQIVFKNGITEEDFVFTTSASVSIKFPPSIGLENSLSTNISDQDFKVYKNNLELRDKADFDGDFDFISNRDRRYIQFLGINSECKYSSSILNQDEVHLRNYGLKSYYINNDIDVTKSIEDFTYFEKYNFLMSRIDTVLPEPMSISGVDIYKIFEENLIPDFTVNSYGLTWNIDIYHEFESNLDRYKISSFNEISEGILLEIDFFSYNIDYDSGPVILKIVGDEGSAEELISIIKNGKYTTSIPFRSIDRIESNLNIVDVDEEPFSIGIKELVPVTKDSLKIFKYSAGSFIVGRYEDDYSSYDLTTGKYNIRYNTKLDISNERFGEKAFIGNSKDNLKPWKSSIEEFKVSNVFYSESDAYKEFLSTKPLCPNKNTMCLIPFNDPYEIQYEALRKQVFLGSDNFKFKLEDEDLAQIMEHINDNVQFVSKLSALGISRDVAQMTYIKCHKAGFGPIFDISNFNPNRMSKGNRPGPTENFSGSLKTMRNGIEIDSSKKIIYENEFSINTWVSPSFDSETNDRDQYIFSASNVLETVVRASNNIITLPQKASSVVRIEAVTKSGDSFLEDHKLYGKYNILGKSGSSFDFTDNSTLLKGGAKIRISEGLSDPNAYYKIYYSSISEKSQHIKLFINKESEVVLDVKGYSKSVMLSKEYMFDHLSWYKFLLTYNAGEIKLFINGENIISYKDHSLNFSSYFGKINFMSDNSNNNVFDGKISSTKISRKANGYKLIGSKQKDINYLNKYSDNRELVLDEYTTYINNFNFELSLSNTFSEVIDKKSGIFDFEIDISDPFNKLNKNYKKDLVEYLVNRIKPAHSNAIVKIKNDRC